MIPYTASMCMYPVSGLETPKVLPEAQFDAGLMDVNRSFRRIFEATLSGIDTVGIPADSGSRYGLFDPGSVEPYTWYDSGFSAEITKTPGEDGREYAVSGASYSSGPSGSEKQEGAVKAGEIISSGEEEPVETGVEDAFAAATGGSSDTKRAEDDNAETRVARVAADDERGTEAEEAGDGDKTTGMTGIHDGSEKESGAAGVKVATEKKNSGETAAGKRTEKADGQNETRESRKATGKSEKRSKDAGGDYHGSTGALVDERLRAKDAGTQSQVREVKAAGIHKDSGVDSGNRSTGNSASVEGTKIDRVQALAEKASGRGAENGTAAASAGNGKTANQERSRLGAAETADEKQKLSRNAKSSDPAEDSETKDVKGTHAGHTDRVESRTARSGEDAGKPGYSGTDSSEEEGTRLKVVDLRSDAGEEDGTRSSGRIKLDGQVFETRETSAKAARPFQNALLQQLRDELNAKIVKQAGVVLKDGGAGEIRLTLKPEHLGNVRFKLELKDNVIAGRIFVENSSVREAFEQNMANLYRAFRESGFETGGLDVHVNNGSDDGKRKEYRSAQDIRIAEIFEGQETLMEVRERGAVDIMA